MKEISIIILSLLSAMSYSQITSSRIEIYKLFSENGEYYLKSIPFDNERGSIYGKTYVFSSQESTPLYTVDRHFNYTGNPNKINLSNDGRTIFYINDYCCNGDIDDQKAITVYTDGQLTSTYSITDLNKCDNNKQDCRLLYQNRKVINRDSTIWIEHQLILGFNKDTPPEEQFANSSNIFSHNDTVYLINQFKQVKTFNLKTGAFLTTSDFHLNYSKLINISRRNTIEIETIRSPSGYKLPPTTNGKNINESLAKHLNMTAMDVFDKNEYKYKRYEVTVDVIIGLNGKLEINNIDVHNHLPEQKIRDFLTSQTFNMKAIPPVLEKWRFNEYLYFRNKSRAKAKKEKQQERIEKQEAYLKNLTLDSINGFYIPKNLGECFVQLDTLLKQKNKDEMKALPDRNSMSKYHHGLGTSLRNNWGLWGGSRLQKYFSERGLSHPDNMSGIILVYYHDWLNGETETWKNWEEKNKKIEEEKH